MAEEDPGYRKQSAESPTALSMHAEESFYSEVPIPSLSLSLHEWKEGCQKINPRGVAVCHILQPLNNIRWASH